MLNKILRKIEWDILENVSENDLVDPKLELFFLELFYKKRIYNQLEPRLRNPQMINQLYDQFVSLDTSSTWMDSNDIIRALCGFYNQGQIVEPLNVDTYWMNE